MKTVAVTSDAGGGGSAAHRNAIAAALAQQGGLGFSKPLAAPAVAGAGGLALALGNFGASAAEGIMAKQQADKQAAATEAARGRFAHMVGSYSPAGSSSAPRPIAAAAGPDGLPTMARGGVLGDPQIQSLMASEEKAKGLPSGSLAQFAQIESKGDPNAYNKGSGASGLMQFIPSTAAQYGLTDPSDPVASIKAGASLMADNAAALRKGLGREPTAGELYLAHQQGAGGALALLTNPDAPAAQSVGQKAVTSNGGTAGMSGGDFARMWTSRIGDGGDPQMAKMPASMPNADPGMMASADLPAPNAVPAGGSGLPGDMQQNGAAPALAMALAAPQPNTMPASGGMNAALGVAAAQAQGDPSMMGAPPPDLAPDGYGTNVAMMAAGSQPPAASPYGIIPPDTGDPAAQSLATALGAFNSQPTPAGTDTPNSGAPLPGQTQPSIQAGTTVGALAPSVRDASNSVADAQAAGMPSFTGLPETNGKRVALSNSPDMGLPPGQPGADPMMAGADVPLPPVRPSQAVLDALGGAPQLSGNSGQVAGTDPAPTGSIDMGSPANMPAPNAVPAMAQGMPADMTGGPGGGFEPIGKNAGFETPQAFNLAQAGGAPGGGNAAMVAALGGRPAPVPADPGAPVGAGAPSPFRQVMDGADIHQVAAQQDARLNGGSAVLANALGGGPAVIPAPAGAPAASPSWRDDAASILSDPYATPAMQSYAAKLLEQQSPAPVSWQHIERPDGSVVAFNPQTQELRQLAGPNAKATTEAPKWQVIGEDAYGNKLYGYPPAPGSSPQASPDGQGGAPGGGAALGLAAGDAALAGLSGQDMLGKLAETQPAVAGQVKAIVEGRAPYPSGLLLKTPYGQRLAALVTQADPTFETGNSGARTKVRADFTSGGPNSSASQIAAGNTALQHLAEVSDAANALGNHDTGLPGNDLYNAAGNALNSFRGRGANQVAFDNVVGKYVEEVTKFYRGTGGTESDIKRDLGNLSSSMSPSELRAAIGAQQALIQGKVTALQDKWHNGMGPLGGDFPIITKNTQSALDRIGSFVNGTPAPAAAPPSAAPAPAPAPVAVAPPAIKALDVGQSAKIGGLTVTKVRH